MKKFFDATKDKLTFELDVDKDGMDYSSRQIERLLKTTGLREISKEEYIKLSNQYLNKGI